MTTSTFKVSGMTCGHCKAAVEEELNRLSGVENASADVEAGIVELRYDESAVGTEDIKGAVEEAGYELTA